MAIRTDKIQELIDNRQDEQVDFTKLDSDLVTTLIANHVANFNKAKEAEEKKPTEEELEVYRKVKEHARLIIEAKEAKTS